MTQYPKIYVAGHRDMVGSAIVRHLLANGHPVERIVTRTNTELDLTNQSAVSEFFAVEKACQVYLAAAKVGGTHANKTYPAEFIYQNLMMQANVIDECFRNGVQKLLFLGSSCIYPKLAKQPMREHALLIGTPEPTNEPYAIAKIADIKLCESYNRLYSTSHGVGYRNTSKAKAKLSWIPGITVQEMCKEMAASDLEDAKHHSLLKANRFKTKVNLE